MYYKWFGSHAGDVGYTGSVIDSEIVYVWYTGGAAPGFEFIFVLALGIIPIIRRKRN